ncbi:paraquat-inducible protein A [Thalassotalea atypica]|uniref:paraquat-inducible protein A n=1 Tax=Thalassotalea atypica TaxID=2054316 RepID=UPI0025724D37|nr:paraquat-inducible protein A [Thalassotalea atypica]
MSKHFGFVLNVIAIALFVPGILLPMFSLNMDVTAQVSGPTLTTGLISKELSLLGTIEELWQDERLLVAGLIFVFSIAIPLIKALLVIWSYFTKNSRIERAIVNFVSNIGKWSMADVFVVAIFLAILSTNHAETETHQTLAIFGFKLEMIISSETLSAVGNGFYFFTAYCLVSLLGTHLSQTALTKKS